MSIFGRWRELDLSGMVVDLGNVVEEALTTPTPDAAKKHITPAQVQLDWEIEELEGGILVDEAKIMRLEGEIADLRRSISEKQAGIAERRKFKAIIDDAASKLEALNSVEPAPRPANRRSRKAGTVEA